MARQYLKNNHVTYYVITHVGVYAEQWYVLPSASTLSGGEYLDFPIEGNSIKNDGLNRLITVVTALTYPYTKNRHCLTGAIPRVARLPVPGVLWG